jgi:hypothetical protein
LTSQFGFVGQISDESLKRIIILYRSVNRSIHKLEAGVSESFLFVPIPNPERFGVWVVTQNPFRQSMQVHPGASVDLGKEFFDPFVKVAPIRGTFSLGVTF